MVIPTRASPWPRADGGRLAGVSSFGFGGTNAHVIVAEAPAPAESAPAAVPERPSHVLTLSARDPNALEQLAQRYAEHAAATTDWPLPDVAFTANCGRQHFSHRLACVASSAGEAQEKLRHFARGQVPAGGFRAEAGHTPPPRGLPLLRPRRTVRRHGPRTRPQPADVPPHARPV